MVKPTKEYKMPAYVRSRLSEIEILYQANQTKNGARSKNKKLEKRAAATTAPPNKDATLPFFQPIKQMAIADQTRNMKNDSIEVAVNITTEGTKIKICSALRASCS